MNYFSQRTLKVCYSFQVLNDGIWMNAKTNDQPCEFETESERDEVKKTFSKKRSLPIEMKDD